MLAVSGASLLATVGTAFVPATVFADRIINGRRIVAEPTGMDFTDCRDADLRHAGLARANLTYAILIHANLNDANLAEAKLAHAHLQLATLRYADLRGALVTATNVRNAKLCKQRCPTGR